jgi:hypothetical protein
MMLKIVSQNMATPLYGAKGGGYCFGPISHRPRRSDITSYRLRPFQAVRVVRRLDSSLNLVIAQIPARLSDESNLNDESNP